MVRNGENNYIIATVLMLSFLLAWLAHLKKTQIEALPALLFFALETAFVSVVTALVFVFLRPTTQFIYFQF